MNLQGSAGLRILELPGCRAAAYAGRLLAAFGAEIALLEIETEVSDGLRRAFLHAGKRSVLVRSGTTVGLRDVASRLSAAADVVLLPQTPDPAELADATSGTIRVTEMASSLHPIDVVLVGTLLALAVQLRWSSQWLPSDDETRVGETRTNSEMDTWPYGLVEVADGWIVTGPGPHDKDTFLRLLGGPENVDATTADRVLAEWAGVRSRSRAFHEAQQWRLPFAPVLHPDAVPSDPHFLTSGALTSLGFPGAVLPVPPFHWSSMPTPRGAPSPGADNRLCVEWGAIAESEYDALVQTVLVQCRGESI